MSVEQAIQVLRAAGAVVQIAPPARRAYSLREAGTQLGVSADWMRDHLHEFPHAYRLPGGGANGGELRIPERDLEAFEKRRRVRPC